MIYKLYTNHHIYIYIFWIIYWSSVSCIPTFHNSWLGLPGRLLGRGWHGSGLAVIAGEAIHRLSHGSWIKKSMRSMDQSRNWYWKKLCPWYLGKQKWKTCEIFLDHHGSKWLEILATSCHKRDMSSCFKLHYGSPKQGSNAFHFGVKQIDPFSKVARSTL